MVFHHPARTRFMQHSWNDVFRSGGHAGAAIRGNDRKSEADTDQGELPSGDRAWFIRPSPVVAATNQLNTNGGSPDHQDFPEGGYGNVSPDIAPGFGVVGWRQN